MPTAPATSPEHLDLAVEGMTCAACAARVERSLNRLDGVTATVNLATERAAVDYDPQRLDASSIAEAVERAGYHAVLPRERPALDVDAAAAARRRLLISLGLTVPVALLSMIPALQFDGWQWVALALTTPVVAWGGWPFHRAAARGARHGVATMDTLVSLATLSAYGWSLWALAGG